MSLIPPSDSHFHSLCFIGSQFPELLALPVHVVESMLKALKMSSEEARLKFPRLLQIIELYPSETLDLMTKEVGVLISGM